MPEPTHDARFQCLPRVCRPAFRRILPWLLILLTGPCLQTGTRAENTPSKSNGIAFVAEFAIADFDGDQIPDLVRVRPGETTSNQTRYWIQLQLTRMGQQLIGVMAPIGGLRVAASDVNGDHATDLVLTTTLGNQPVAILLNDGHGEFTALEPGAFPDAFRPASTEKFSQEQRLYSATSATQLRPALWWESKRLRRAEKTRVQAGVNFATSVSASLLNHRGRAPPSIS
jgi:hypothetical protein